MLIEELSSRVGARVYPPGLPPPWLKPPLEEHYPMPKTMFEKIWDAHIVREVPGESTILYIDRHLVHEMTSPQAFAGLRLAGRPVHRTDATIAVLDHNVPTVQGRRMLDVVDKE